MGVHEMSQWDNDDDFNEPQQPTGSGLRKQLEDALAKLNEQAKTNAELQKQLRARNVADVLSGLGVKDTAKFSKLVPQDAADDPEKVKAWVDEFRDVLNLAPAGQAATPTQEDEAPADEPAVPSIDPAQMEALQRLQNADASAGTTAPDLDGQTLSRLTAMHQAANGSPDSFFAALRGQQ
jgi:hypothetical protein